MNEADTRAQLIDPELKLSGWAEVTESKVQREFPINAGEIKAGGIRVGKLKADYVLSYKNRKLAVIEAKSDQQEVGEGVTQAKQYSTKLQLPYAYAANGKQIYEICLTTGQEGLVDKFPTPDELWDKAFGEVNEWLKKFNAIPFEDINGTKQARYYQEIAVNRVIEAIANNQGRILLTLATGTGKTFVAFQIAWKLFKTRWNLNKDGARLPRILFLADRNILANQASLAFSAFQEDAIVRIKPSEISRAGTVPKNASIFFTIFQTFMSGPEGEPYYKNYEPDFFDFVIIDECHRGGANDEGNWRAILEYFSPAVQLGLTATPKRETNADTYRYFGDPVYQYSLKDGIQDGFLTPFKVKRIQTTLDQYQYTRDDEVLEGEVEEGYVYEGADFNTRIVIEARERKIVKEMLASINPDQKTLVFCANQAHAALIRDLINQESPSKPTDYCVRVTANDGEIGDTYLKQFQDNDKTIPTIITTSQKLTTGVDALNVRFIVLMRPINSMIEFKQIIGRGTRLFEGKYFFTIIDFVDAYERFQDPDWDGPPAEPPQGPNPPQPPRPPSDPPTGDPPGPESGNKRIKIKLSDGKERAIQAMQSTHFLLDGRVVSAQEFVQKLFDTLKLPEIFKNEDELRKLWSNPTTRKVLLQKLEDNGCTKSDLIQLQEMIEAEDSDLFDVLEYISFARQPISRSDRANQARRQVLRLLNDKQNEFVEFILSNYVKEGIDELDIDRLGISLNAKYQSTYQAKQELGDLESIKSVFIEFQQYLYKVA